MKRVPSVLSIAVATAVLSPFGATAAAHDSNVVREGQSIQKAIDEAGAGDTIVVRRGVYRESLLIDEDGITLRGERAKLRPPDSPPESFCNEPGAVTGICVVGQINPQTFEVERPVQDVRITGFTVRGFSGEAGILSFGTDGLRVDHNKLIRNGGYGVFSLASTGTRHDHNLALRNGGPGFYVGDSPNSGATVRRNRSINNQGEGIFLRSASHGRATRNVVAGNCVGILVLGDAPGPATDWKLARNGAFANNRFCPGGEEGGPALSGIGVALADADRIDVSHNKVIGNRPSGESAFSGGIVVVNGTDNTVRQNKAFRNAPADLFWNESGTVDFEDNRCRTSIPGGLCPD
jgi:nitrous oxidase accessory protein NosD